MNLKFCGKFEMLCWGFPFWGRNRLAVPANLENRMRGQSLISVKKILYDKMVYHWVKIPYFSWRSRLIPSESFLLTAYPTIKYSFHWIFPPSHAWFFANIQDPVVSILWLPWIFHQNIHINGVIPRWEITFRCSTKNFWYGNHLHLVVNMECKKNTISYIPIRKSFVPRKSSIYCNFAQTPFPLPWLKFLWDSRKKNNSPKKWKNPIF